MVCGRTASGNSFIKEPLRQASARMEAARSGSNTSLMMLYLRPRSITEAQLESPLAVQGSVDQFCRKNQGPKTRGRAAAPASRIN